MERTEVDAITTEDFELFLSSVGLLEDFRQGKVQCARCGRPLTVDNVGFIVRKGKGFSFKCGNLDCADSGKSQRDPV